MRFINDAIKCMVEKTYGSEQTQKFKTKSLRDAYNDALLRADIKQEVKDTLFGHKSEGAREKYAISQATIIGAYNKAFQFLSVNHGTQARKDFEAISDRMREMQNNNDAKLKNLNSIIEVQSKRMQKLENKLDSFGVDPSTITKMVIKALKEVKEEEERNKPEKVDPFT